MNRMTKIAVVALALAGSLTAGAYPGPRHHHHYHHGGTGFAIGAGILGAGLIASAIYDATRPAPPVVVAPSPVVVAPAPTVVAAPVVVTAPAPVAVQTGRYETRVQNVWVEGRYIDQQTPQGTIVRTWQPGHYEQQQTQVWVP